MTKRNHTNCIVCASIVAAALALTGCQERTSATVNRASSAADGTSSAAQGTSSSTDGNSSAELPQAVQPTSDTATAQAAAADQNAAATPVLLGSPQLTAGIPGEGPLTVDQIRAWLADPKNHEVLQAELPLGLSLGAEAIVVPEDNPLTRAKIELGRQLYFDPRLSVDGTVSCSSCHNPETGYTAHTQFGVGIQGLTGNRNSPVSYNRILSGAQFWDGRAASLEDQAVGPIANPIEMAFTHDGCVECLKTIEGYRIQFERIFGGVTIEAVGKAIASFERVIVTGPSPFDYFERLQPIVQLIERDYENDLEFFEEDNPQLFARYKAWLAEAEKHPMSPSAQRGLVLFRGKAECSTCHSGANFSDEKFHNLGIGMEVADPDLGRYAVSKDEQDKGAFKTPTVRNVELTAPYMHDGSLKTLEEVVAWYDRGGHPNPWLSDKIKRLNLTDEEKADLVEFMKACTGPFPVVQTGRLPQ